MERRLMTVVDWRSGVYLLARIYRPALSPEPESVSASGVKSSGLSVPPAMSTAPSRVKHSFVRAQQQAAKK
ncbi:MAG: hypothetical protein ACTTKL_01255 [Treponema sp.]